MLSDEMRLCSKVMAWIFVPWMGVAAGSLVYQERYEAAVGLPACLFAVAIVVWVHFYFTTERARKEAERLARMTPWEIMQDKENRERRDNMLMNIGFWLVACIIFIGFWKTLGLFALVFML